MGKDKKSNSSLTLGIAAWLVPLIANYFGRSYVFEIFGHEGLIIFPFLTVALGAILAMSARSFGKNAKHISGKIGRILGTLYLIALILMIAYAFIRPLVGKFLQ
jgi:hypothetical protein